MVVTPWGDSETLRGRMLPPGPANDAAEVAANQRARLLGAMVASVAERGYLETRVADLVETSGVSLRSFYELYPDKGACFLAAVEALVRTTIDLVLATPGEEDWEEDSRRRLLAAAELLTAQPAAARLCLVEAYVAGAEATERIDAAAVRAEELIRDRLAASPRWAEMPPDIAVVTMAAILETFRSRLLRSQERLLPDVAGEIADLMLSYEPPARPLRAAPRPPEVRPEEREASDHAERALRAFEALLTEQPFAETTMEQVAKRARMSARTLYANFASREELMLAAIDSAGALAVAAALPAQRRGASPPEGIRAAFGALFGLLASRPNLAKLLLCGVYEGGAAALERRREALWPLELLLMRATPTGVTASRKVVAEAILGGLLGLARRRLVESGPGALAGLVQISTYIALAPVLGAESATAAAEGKSYRRPRTEVAESIRDAGIGAQGERIILPLTHGPVSVEEMAEETGLSRAQVEASIAQLEEQERTELVVVEGEDGVRRYESRWPLIEGSDWRQLGVGEREQISAEIGLMIRKEVEESAAAGSFDARPERWLVRLPVWLDERGWLELNESLDRSLEDCLAVQRRAQERLNAGGDPAAGFAARVLLVSFEMPRRGGPDSG